MKLKEHEPQSLSQAVAKAMKLETLYKSFERQKDAARPRLARSTQPDERQNRNGNNRPGGSKQYEARPTNNYNKDNNIGDEPRQNSTWKSRDIGVQSKENDELTDQVRQLSMKFSELTIKVNQTSNEVTGKPIQSTVRTTVTVIDRKLFQPIRPTSIPTTYV